MWSSPSGPSRPVSYGFLPEMGMLGLRDLFLVPPAAAAYHQDLVSSDHNSMNNASNPTTALGVGVIPLLTTTPCLGSPNTNMNNDRNDDDHNMMSGRNRNLWLQAQAQQHHQLLLKKNQNLHGGGSHLMTHGGNFGSSAALTCQDCGNQAKKDCSHRRCRTCCKSRGLDCATHVKSTWVPASRRRERQLMSDGVAAGAAGSSSTTSHTNNTSSNAKKQRLLVTSQNTTPSHTNSTSNTTPPRSYDTTSKHQHQQDGGFPETMPGQVRAPTVFKCVRVTAVDDGAEDEYAYHAVVKINGHVFKGFLYDQGVEAQCSRDHHGFPNIADLHLGGRGGGGATSTTPTGRSGGDPSDPYAAAAGGLLLGGSNFGNSINQNGKIA